MRRIGTQLPLSDEERTKLLEDLDYWHVLVQNDDYFATRERYEDALDCRWEGQDPCGLRKDRDDKAAWPFDGASDQRLRWGDTIFKEKLALIMIAISSCGKMTAFLSVRMASFSGRSASLNLTGPSSCMTGMIFTPEPPGSMNSLSNFSLIISFNRGMYMLSCQFGREF